MPRFEPRRLIGFGLSIASDCDVPGAVMNPSPGAAAELRIATLPPRPLDDAAPVYRWEGGTLTFSAAGVGRYDCRSDSIAVAAVPGGDPAMVAALLVATALPAVGWLRGDAMLHAAGVVAPARAAALLIAGPSGVGKSALTAQLLRRGGALLADDSVRLRLEIGGVAASGLPGGYHLAPAGDDERHFHRVPAANAIESAPVGAVLILSRTSGPPALVRLRPVDAVARLAANLHRPAVPATLGKRAQALATTAFIAEHCAVYDWRRPRAALDAAECELLAREDLW